MSVRVLIVEPQALVRAGLASLVNAAGDLEAVGEAGSAGEAIFEARTTKPDVVLLDVTTEQSAIEAVSRLLEERPETKVLVLSKKDDPRYVREAFEAGASGYVLKEAADVEVVDAIRQVAEGGSYVHPRLGARMVAADAAARAAAAEDPLSDREREVLELLAFGHTNQEIAKQLYISLSTTKVHVKHIYEKLGVRSRLEAARALRDDV